MADYSLEIWKESDVEGVIFYKWPFYNIGVEIKPAAALSDVLKSFQSLLLEKESAGRVLARLIDKGAKAGISLNLHINNVEEALEGISENHRLRAAISSLKNEGAVFTSNAASGKYSYEGLRRIFGLS